MQRRLLRDRRRLHRNQLVRDEQWRLFDYRDLYGHGAWNE
jgi:hypothetical protein